MKGLKGGFYYFGLGKYFFIITRGKLKKEFDLFFFRFTGKL